MTADDLFGWGRVEPLLDQALDLPPHARRAFLERACGSDVPLRAHLERMLAAGEDPESPLEHSLAIIAGPLMAEFGDAPPAAIRIGEMLGPWKLVEELGHGGMGEVFRAERADGQFAQTAALKLVRRGREHDPLLIDRFLEERRILATLAHPHIARLLDGGVTAAGLPWFAMEYVAGRPLDDYCDEHRLDVPARLALVEQVLGAVAYAHRNLLVHRDLKPSNIFVTSDGDVKLLDFGIAKLLGTDGASDPEFTLAYGRVMTPEYAAPEQVRGEPVTTATDIYSLGAVLYQLVTGQRAHRFAKQTAAEIERVVCDTDPVPPSAAVRASRDVAVELGWSRGIASDLDTIVLTALQKDPARRYVSAEAMLDDLRRLRTGRPLLARPDSVSYRWGKFARRHRVAVASVAVVALALAGGVVTTTMKAREARLEAVRADEVKEFLIDLLHQADPDITGGKDMTVRQLLDRGTQRVDSMLGREPVVQAELYEVLGNTYSHLGLLSQADALHRKGLAVVRRLYGPGDPEVLNQAMAVAWGLNDQGKYSSADTLLGAAISEYRAARGERSQALSDALDVLATTKKRLDHPASAESLYRQSLGLQIELTGAADTITASRLSDLAALLATQDRLIAAESALTAAQEHRRGVLSPLDLKYLVGESSLATLRMKRGAFADADARLETAVSGLEQIEKPGGLNLARTLDRLALLRSLQIRSTDAVRTGERAFAMFDSVMGDDHPETLNSRSLLAGYYADVGDIAPAMTDARDAYDRLRQKMGDRHDWTLAAGQRLALVTLQAGDDRAARRAVDTVLTTVRDKYGRVPPQYAILLALDATLRARSNDSVAAAAGFRDALSALGGGTRVDSAALPRIIVAYDAFLAAHGHAAMADSLAIAALRLMPPPADARNVIASQLTLRTRTGRPSPATPPDAPPQSSR